MATKKFTDFHLKNLQPREQRYDVREGDGFGIRVYPNGGKSFFYIYQLNGLKRRMTLGSYPAVSLKDARRDHAAALSLVSRKIDPAAKRAKEMQVERELREEDRLRPTVAALADEYVERHAKPNKRTWKHDRYLLDKEIVPVWGTRKARDITRRDVTLLLDGITERGATTHANRILSLTRKLFNFALQRDVLSVNPCNGVQKPVDEKPRDRALSADEVRMLWPALEPESSQFRASAQIKLALRLMLLTAVRAGEAAHARWEEIDLLSRWWEIPAERMKNKKPHRIWLTQRAVTTLCQLKDMAGHSSYVFPSPSKKDDQADHHISTTAFNHAIRRSLEHFKPEGGVEPKPSSSPLYQLSIAPFTPHDLRRTVATGMGEIGIAPNIIGKVLAHTDQTVTGKHYDKYGYDRDKRAAVEAWDSRLSEIIREDREQTVVPLIRSNGNRVS